jgi:hypothetical protein
MAVRDDFAPGEVLAAADLNDTFASKLDLAGGKILQIVRATDVTQRTTSSTTFVDVTGMSVTITPQKNTSAVLLLASFMHEMTSGTTQTTGRFQITDASNNTISGAEQMLSGMAGLNSYHHRAVVLIAYATPATTSATTYKLRFRTDNALSQCSLLNQLTTGQMYAIEVSA